MNKIKIRMAISILCAIVTLIALSGVNAAERVELYELSDVVGLDGCPSCIEKEEEPCSQEACRRYRCVTIFNDKGDACQKKDPSPGSGPLPNYRCAESQNPDSKCKDNDKTRFCERYLEGVCDWSSAPYMLACDYTNAITASCGGSHPRESFEGDDCE